MKFVFNCDSLGSLSKDHMNATLTIGPKHNLLLVDQECPLPWNTHRPIKKCNCFVSYKFCVKWIKSTPLPLFKWNRIYTYIPSPKSSKVRHRAQKPSWRATSILMMDLRRDKWCCVSPLDLSLLSSLSVNYYQTANGPCCAHQSIRWILGTAMLIQCWEIPNFSHLAHPAVIILFSGVSEASPWTC